MRRKEEKSFEKSSIKAIYYYEDLY